MTRNATTFVGLIVFTALYIAAGKLGLSMAFLNASASPIWPPTGLALAAMLLFGCRLWPAVLVGAFVVNLTTAGTISTSAVIAAGNTMEAVVGVMLVRRFAAGTAAFELVPNIFRFTVFAAIPSTMISATVGVTCLAVAHFVRWDLYGQVWMTWWTGDFVGDLLIAPLLIIWATAPRPTLTLPRLLEALALAAVLIVLGDLIFVHWHSQYGQAEALAYLAVPLLIWAAFRFRQRGAAAAAFVLSAIAVRGTLRGAGPFATGNANESLVLLQTFLGVNTLMALILAAVVAERMRAHREREQILQRERSARTEAEHANRAKDQFLAMLSHELRTPLSPVLLATTLMEDSPDLPGHLSEYVQMIRRNVELERRLIDDLLDLTRITRGKFQLNLTTADVHEVLRRAVEICCAGRAGDLVLKLAAPRHHIKGDPARLQQVFWNLVNNAAKFTPVGRSITIRSRNVDEQSAIEIEVSDTGAGIEPQFLPRLFNAFEQGDTTRARTFGGLGLGLAITKALAEAHGGTVAAHSAGRDAGATFTVRLPVTADVPQRESEPAPKTKPVQKRVQALVLLVEDHEETLQVMAELLRRLGHEVTTASTIKEALKAAGEKPFDLVISDLGLPDGLGYELMRSLRAGNHLRGIALSGYGMSEDIQLSREAGFAEHLVKPVDLKKLEEAMARVLAVQE
ncbi:MAG TPA: MASE1 domain-containing protein [Tepidisphaeraceae bacterium]|jgi:signal transduction histidine kinase|nr:MASE1 domain-containing protein [Tepidisphaeraceae bacterium]